MKQGTFIDFDDSFSFNIIQELSEAGLKVNVLNWKDFEDLPSSELLILGPGPGHPDDYQRIFPLIEKWLKLGKPVFALCLGHQILWRMRGEEIVRSKEPMHGQRVVLKLDETWRNWLHIQNDVQVMRYNSLAVMGQSAIRNPDLDVLLYEDEIMISKNSQVITYQFHPESLGTSYRQAFFKTVLRDLV